MSQLLVVTGANRGFGHAFTQVYVESARARKEQICVVLIGRNEEALAALGESLETLGASCVVLGSVDLANTSTLPENLVRVNDALRKHPQSYSKAVFLQNAGSLGDLSKTVRQYDLSLVQKYFDFNVTSFSILCSVFIEFIHEHSIPSSTIVNVSSLLAVQAFPYWGLYASAKSARDQLIRVIALEEKEHGIKTLSWAPGPLDNDMQQDVRSTIGDEQQRSIYTNMHKERKLVDMKDSAKKLLTVLDSNDFESGAHIDYYDV
ncbi:uncharacterized protein VTP21DRAFT_7148 [Calcarisporiella thermophila]|uniref:uncharacterized protein n=1 Tax=Calcarisporiella thermophila TaxID=911321 RepID=UPI003742FF72